MRRTTLTISALTLIASAGLLTAGPLNPPAGPVTPTYKTLNEVEARRPISTLPFTITQPGSYYLTGKITGVSGKKGISVLANNVSIDLCGFSMDGGGVGDDAIYIDFGYSSLSVRNGIISMVTVLGLNIAYLVGGTLVIEKVFALPGIGALMIDSILQRDFTVVQGITLVFAILVVLINLITDIVHSLLDPRVRFD